jgi:NTE family protein
MDAPVATKLGPSRVEQRPQFERIALLLQGGGALGAYQAGVYQALAEANLHPDWIAGISIGAINAALIAGNHAAKRVERLREFWELVSTPPLGVPHLQGIQLDEMTRRFVNQTRALGILFFGAPHFFKPRFQLPFVGPSREADEVSYYDVTPLRATLERLVDFDRINAGTTRFSVGAANVRTGNFVYFDTDTHTIRPEHVMASGALPPGSQPSRSKASFIGTAASSRILPCSGWLRPSRAATLWLSRSICGAPAVNSRATSSRS